MVDSVTDFSHRDLRGRSFIGAHFRGANLRGALLQSTDFSGADLRGANLTGAELWQAKFRGADLRGAKLEDSDLMRADFTAANLTWTCLDPANEPNGDVADFARDPEDPEYVLGYRTRSQPYQGGEPYRDGETYRAPWFSTADTKCHPGLYLCPGWASGILTWGPGSLIQVRVRASDVHHARGSFIQGKWRCRGFTVVGPVHV